VCSSDLVARGEVLNLPTDEGDGLNLTRTTGSREKNATWSPDGRWIALVSDRSGEEQVYLVDQRGKNDWRQLTEGTYGYLNQPVWSPDSKSLIFSDKFMKLHLVDVASGKVNEIAHSDYDDAWERWGIMDYVWSPDSRWIAFTNQTVTMNEAIHLYDTKSGDSQKLTDDMTEDWSPSFSPDGKYLYFLSNRTFNPIMGRQDQTHVFLKMCKPYLFLLQADARSPFETDDVMVEVGKDEDGEELPDLVYVTGEVNSPGPFVMNKPTTVLQALARSGGLGPFAAKKRIQIRRKIRDRYELYSFDYKAVERGYELEGNIYLKDGDVIVVPERRLFE